jgi:hypothetical protein
LADDDFSDAGMPRVARMGGLQTLNLNQTCITDAGVVHLAGLTNLTEIMLYDTRVSDEAVQKLQAARPNCRESR